MNFSIFILLSSAFLLFTISYTHGQQGSVKKVSGEVVDEKAQPASFANVLLLNPRDSTLITGMVADDNGKYSIEVANLGDFLVVASMTGYQKVYSKKYLSSNSGQQVSIPRLVLVPDISALQELTIVAKKPFITQEADRMVINVENSIVSAGATALEVLERSPGVTVDQQNDRLQLRGKEGVIVQIDGKQSYLSQQELINLLKNTPSDNIEKIELITNPSAKYDAAGNSGIINIQFKRNKNFGTNGTVTLGGGISSRNHPRGNGSISLNHRKGQVSIFGTLNGFTGSGFSEQYIKRAISHEGKKTHFDMASMSQWNYFNNFSARAGMDYFLSDKTTIGVLVSSFYNKWESPLRTTDTDIRNDDQSLRQTYKTESHAFNRMNNATANLNLKHKFNTDGKELTFDLDYVQYDGKGFNAMDTRYFKPDGTPTGNPDIVRNNMPSLIQIGAAKLDYTQKIGKNKVEMGLKSSYVASDNNMVYENKADDWVIDSSRTNLFKYKENINAAYVSYSGNLNPKTKYQFGLRLEHTYSSGNSVTLNKVVDRNYVNLFPSIFISRDLDSNNVLNASYSRRIDRPNYQSLNPFEFYLDPYTFQRGNPNLKPQYTNSFQLTHVYKHFLNTTVAYSRVKDMIAGEVPMVIPEENKTFMTSENLDKQNYLSLTIGAPIPLRKWWNLQVNFTGAYNQYKTFYRNAPYDVKILTGNLYGNNQFTLPREWTIEAGGWYNSPSVYGLLKSKSQGMVNLGLQKSINNKKTVLKFNVQDVFWTNRYRGSTQFEDIDLTVNARWPSRQFRLVITHRFGNQNVKAARQRGTGSDELQQRAAGNGNS